MATFKDPIDFSLLDEKSIDKIVQRQVNSRERYTFIFYKKSDDGTVKLEAYRQVLSDGDVRVEADQLSRSKSEDSSYESMIASVIVKFSKSEADASVEEEVEVENAEDLEEPVEEVVDEAAEKGSSVIHYPAALLFCRDS